ncbi:MAG: long-chain fatty acid--CoA ligase, partial [Bacteroidales bacterium]|nr:long-chain fatty acid--CoA ligase [Bacteroidales bacterium]
ILNNMPYIQESLVIDEDEKLVALVYPEQDTVEKEKLSLNNLTAIFNHTKDLVNKELPKYMQLWKIRIHDEEFAKTPKKSIKRFLYQTKK